nr:hypothetical protein Ade03nite_79050 [Actinoplanes derwentensis]
MSRGRKKTKSRQSVRRDLTPAPGGPQECDCPECSGTEFDPGVFINELIASATVHLDVEDPLEAELFGASFAAAGEVSADGFTEALSGGIVPALALVSSTESLGVLLAIDAVLDGVGAGDAARHLLTAGVTAPAWAGELKEPVTAGPVRRYSDGIGEASILQCSFERAGRTHGFLIHVDHLDCAAAADIALVPGEMLDGIEKMVVADARRSGVRLTAEDLDPAELRWQAERALSARLDHDRDEGAADLGDDDDEGPGYHSLAVLLRARLRVLPEPSRPPATHGDDAGKAALEQLAQLSAQARSIQAGGRLRRPLAPKLPAKRKKSDGPAPILQIKVSLRGAKPPIWRRLELPGDTSLADLHHILQTTFGWQDGHMHVFETPYGEFGVADRELEHRAEKPVTLEQVAPATGDKVRYLYDFGDNWEHEIVVEKILDRTAGAYPRCTGGRRAAPPDDCGGIWGYTELVEILTDPTHPEHADRLEWLGLRSAADFDPSHFDAAAVTTALTSRG